MVQRRIRRSAISVALTALLAGAGGFLLSLSVAAPASASLSTSIVWGHSESVRSYYYVAGSQLLRSSDSKERLDFTLAGDLRLQKEFYCGYSPCGEESTGAGGASGYFSYWRTHISGDSLYEFQGLSNGRIRVLTSTGSVAWQSGSAPGTSYNYGLQIDTLGRLREWYSTGNPFGTGHHLAWSVDRIVGQTTVCTGLPLDSGTNNADFLAQNGTSITVTVNNANFVGLPATVYRYVSGNEYHAQAYVLGPYSKHTFNRGWYILDNLPEVVNMRISTSANNVVASYSVKGWCWYRP
jgi:hypothetical protein